MNLLLNKVVGPHNLIVDELYSFTVEIEAVNSWSLTPLESTLDDKRYLLQDTFSK